ncbi:hypothetical protein BDN72DRAFT_839385 [Pluteus cervinus]|uniref:Uncharacterized protein n=1 Tax=Pluteus cervinus TaxID=181527 RepID=A0ACD3AWM4_9AGAR|nr:hypothetical protein BDN72DRAFT_839385 [Pluteus cervinus]
MALKRWRHNSRAKPLGPGRSRVSSCLLSASSSLLLTITPASSRDMGIWPVCYCPRYVGMSWLCDFSRLYIQRPQWTATPTRSLSIHLPRLMANVKDAWPVTDSQSTFRTSVGPVVEKKSA